MQAVILLSNATSVMGLIAFGSAPSYMVAITARFVPALLNGCAVAMKSMLGESCDATNQARALAIFTLGWGFGSIVGPLLGGLLSEPCDKIDSFPLCGPNQLFRLRYRTHIACILAQGSACAVTRLGLLVHNGGIQHAVVDCWG